MKSIFKAIFLLSIFNLITAEDLEALKLCGNLHHTDVHLVPNFRAEFKNGKCLLNCFVANQTLSSGAVNEGFACEQAGSSGTCRQGQCILSNLAAQKECSKHHHFDFTTLNNTGTEYTNSSCTLKCGIEGKIISVHEIHEGEACPANHNGICQKGICVTHESTKPTPAPPTTISPTTFKIHRLNLTVNMAHTSVSLNHTKAIVSLTKRIFEGVSPTVHAIFIGQTKEVALETSKPSWMQDYTISNIDKDQRLTIDVRGKNHANHSVTATLNRNVYDLFHLYYREPLVQNGNLMVHEGFFSFHSVDPYEYRKYLSEMNIKLKLAFEFSKK